MELIDSLDGRRVRAYSDCEGVSEGRLGGSAGDCSAGRREGRAGPDDDGADVLGGSAGRLMPSMPWAAAEGLSASGSLPMPLLVAGAQPFAGGRLVD